MAIDNTSTAVKLIKPFALVGVVALVGAIALVGLSLGLMNYHQIMSDQVAREKASPLTTELADHQKAEHDALVSAKVDQAMVDFSKGARASVTPQPSDDIGPMKGWSKLPKPAPVPEPRPIAPSEQAGAGDAGATTAGDAGVAASDSKSSAADAGAAAKGPAPHTR